MAQDYNIEKNYESGESASSTGKKTLLGLVLFRIITITVLLGSTTVVNIRSGHSWTPAQQIMFMSIGWVYLLSIFYLLAIKYNTSYRFQTIAQLSVDVIFWSCLIYLAGGLHSPFTFLYTLSIIHGSMLLGKRGAWYAGLFSAICFLLLIWLEGNGIFHTYLKLNASYTSIWELNELYQIFLNLVMFFLIVLLASNLASQVETRDQILTEQQLGLEMQRMLNRSIVMGISSGFIMIDRKGRVTFFNLAAERIAGISHVDARDMELEDIFPELSGFIEKELNQESWARFTELKIEKPNESPRHISFSFSDLLGANNKRMGSIVMMDDISERRRLEEKAFRNEKLAAIGELAAGIAHEIRNPLASISGAIQILESELPPGDDNDKLIEITTRETDRLNNLIDDFLSFARPKKPAVDVIDMREVMEDIIELLTGSKEESHLRIRVEYDDAMPDLQADPGMIRQILWNILKNAIEATEKSSLGVVWVKVSTDERINDDGEHILLEVRDNGHGMDKKIQDRLFDPFYTTKSEGTGLGMSVVYQAVLSHKGVIEVESDIGRGTMFRVSLPCNPKTNNNLRAIGG